MDGRDNTPIDPNGLYYRLKFPKKINGCSTIAELAKDGCPICAKRFNVEASAGFGSLHCPVHKVIWIWIPGTRDRQGYTSHSWKNYFTQEVSKEWKRRFPEGR